MNEPLVAPFPYFGGKMRIASEVWRYFGNVPNYVEPFAGSAAVLLARPDAPKVETINDMDGFVSNFWRAVAHDVEGVVDALDWPVNENDLLARHSYLVRAREGLTDSLHGDPDWFDARIAGWWAWGACNWIGTGGTGWCSGQGPWVHDGATIVDRRVTCADDAGKGVNRKIPHLGDAGKGVNRKTSPTQSRREFIHNWILRLHQRMRGVRVTCGDWKRVTSTSVTTRHGVTGMFLDPPYTVGNADYAVGGSGGAVADEVREWCKANGDDPKLRIILCGHAGEHEELVGMGWSVHDWKRQGGYARTSEAVANSGAERMWISPHCLKVVYGNQPAAAEPQESADTEDNPPAKRGFMNGKFSEDEMIQ